MKLMNLSKYDINIELPDHTNKILTKIVFDHPHTYGDPNYHHLFHTCTLFFDYRFRDKIWIKAYNNDLNSVFDNFSLANNFILYRKRKTTTYIDKVNSRWDKENKTMYVDC